MRVNNKKTGGFTLVETILTILVIGIIAGVSAKILISGLDTYSFVTNRKNATQQARVAMDRMVSELTRANWSDITWMANNRLGFTDRDGSSTSFRKGSTNGVTAIYRGNDILAVPLGYIDFDYLKANGTDAVFNFNIKKINIELSVESLGGYGAVELRTEIFPRQLMYDNFQ